MDDRYKHTQAEPRIIFSEPLMPEDLIAEIGKVKGQAILGRPKKEHHLNYDSRSNSVIGKMVARLVYQGTETP